MTQTESTLLSKIPQRQPRPNVIAIAKGVLQDDLRIEPGARYLLRYAGTWRPVILDEVMRATNRRLKAEGRRQITINSLWVV
jgi:hypothetical protein